MEWKGLSSRKRWIQWKERELATEQILSKLECFRPNYEDLESRFNTVGSPPNTSTSARVCGCRCILGWWFILLEAMEVVVIIIQECAALRPTETDEMYQQILRSLILRKVL
jgi:hypothetical protein